MSLIEKYVAEMKDRPFTMVLLCIVTMMSLSTSVNYVPTSRHDHLMRHVFVQQQRLIKTEYGLHITEQRAYRNSKEDQLNLLRFLQSTDSEFPEVLANAKRGEIRLEIAAHQQAIVRLYSQQEEELEEMEAMYGQLLGQSDTSIWNML